MAEDSVPKAEKSPLIYLNDAEARRLTDCTLGRFAKSDLHPSAETVYSAIKSVGYEKDGAFDWRISYTPVHIAHNADFTAGTYATMAFVPRRLLVLENIDGGTSPVVPVTVKNAMDGIENKQEMRRIFGPGKTRRGYSSEKFVRNALENEGLVRVLKQIRRTTPFALLGVFNMKTEGVWHDYPLLCVPDTSDAEQKVVLMAAESGVPEYVLRGHN